MQIDPKKKNRLVKVADLAKLGWVAVTKHLFEIEDRIETFESKIETKVSELEKTVRPQLDNVLKQVKGEQGPKGDKPVAGVDYPIPENGKDYVLTDEDKQEIAQSVIIPTIEVEKVIERTEVIKEIPIVTNNEIIKEVAKSDTGKQIVDKINELPVEDEYLIDKSRIRGLEEALKSAKGTVVYQGGGMAGRDLFKDIDISASLDGVTKTFNLPAVWNIISVDLSSFPYGSLRKNVDYTYTPTSITFTSEIDAATQLAAGQSCVLTVVTA